MELVDRPQSADSGISIASYNLLIVIILIVKTSEIGLPTCAPLSLSAVIKILEKNSVFSDHFEFLRSHTHFQCSCKVVFLEFLSFQ